jgi:hypothetical protein
MHHDEYYIFISLHASVNPSLSDMKSVDETVETASQNADVEGDKILIEKEELPYVITPPKETTPLLGTIV